MGPNPIKELYFWALSFEVLMPLGYIWMGVLLLGYHGERLKWAPERKSMWEFKLPGLEQNFLVGLVAIFLVVWFYVALLFVVPADFPRSLIIGLTMHGVLYWLGPGISKMLSGPLRRWAKPFTTSDLHQLSKLPEERRK